MSTKARKIRTQVLFHRIILAADKGIIPQKKMKELMGQFTLEHGISVRTFWEYIEQFESIGLLSNNFQETIDNEDLDYSSQEEFDEYLHWKVNEEMKLPEYVFRREEV